MGFCSKAITFSIRISLSISIFLFKSNISNILYEFNYLVYKLNCLNRLQLGSLNYGYVT